MRFRALVAVVGVLLAAMTVNALAASQVKSVRLWRAPDNTRLVFDLSGPVQHSVFTLTAPDRLVIDINGASLAAPLKVSTANTPITAMRSAQRTATDLRVVIDPVMGDHDHGIYVDTDMAEAYRQLLLPLAHGLTPNGFELAHLTGRPVDDTESVVAAARTLLTGCTQWIAVTSAAPDTWAHGEMQVVLVTRAQAHVITHARIDAVPKGTGDLFCAALTGHWLNGATLPEAIARACQTIVQALRHTHNAQCAELVLPSRVASPQANSQTHARELVRIRQAFSESHWSHRTCNTPLPI